MSDADLDEIRAKRLAQLQAQYKGGGGGPREGGDTNAQDETKKQEDMKNIILSQCLNQAARARLNTLMLGKPEKGRRVESILLHMAQTGQIMQKLGEEELIGILESINDKTQKTTTVKFDRRRAALDSDDDL